MTGLLVLALDPDVAGHLAVALRRHRSALNKAGLAEPGALAQLQDIAEQAHSSSSNQEAADGVSVIGAAEDGFHDRIYLSRSDLARITGASTSTIDRWIRSGDLPSIKHGRTRRVARSDLERFLAA